MRSILIVAGLASALAGCNTNINPNVASPRAEIIGINVYIVAGNAARVYLASPACTTRPPAALCQSVDTAIKSMRTARKQIIAALKAHQDAPLTAIDTLRAAYSVLQSIPKT